MNNFIYFFEFSKKCILFGTLIGQGTPSCGFSKPEVWNAHRQWMQHIRATVLWQCSRVVSKEIFTPLQNCLVLVIVVICPYWFLFGLALLLQEQMNGCLILETNMKPNLKANQPAQTQSPATLQRLNSCVRWLLNGNLGNGKQMVDPFPENMHKYTHIMINEAKLTFKNILHTPDTSSLHNTDIHI